MMARDRPGAARRRVAAAASAGPAAGPASARPGRGGAAGAGGTGGAGGGGAWGGGRRRPRHQSGSTRRRRRTHGDPKPTLGHVTRSSAHARGQIARVWSVPALDLERGVRDAEPGAELAAGAEQERVLVLERGAH